MLVKLCDFLFSTVLETRRETTAAAMSWPVAFILAQKKMWQCDCADKVEQREREREVEREFDMPAALLAAFLAEFCLRPEEDLALAIACQWV